MTRVRACCALGLGAALLVLGPNARAEGPGVANGAAAGQAGSEDADQLYDEGRAAAKRGQLEKARELYQRSWRLRPHWQVAGSLGRIELTTGKFRDAAEHLTYFLEQAPTSVDEAARKAAREMLDKARSNVGELRITVSLPGAAVLVDGQAVGTAPLAGVVFVNPGLVFVEARLDGYEAAKVSRTAAAGGEESVGLQLVKAPVGGKSGPVATAQEPAGPNRTIVIAGIALSSTAAAAGIGFAIASPFHPGHKGDLVTLPNLAFWSGVGAVAAGGATLVYYEWNTAPDRTKSAPHPAVIMSYHGTGFAAKITW